MSDLRPPPIPLEYAKAEGRWPPFLEWKTLGLIVCYVVLMHAANLGRVETRRTAFEPVGSAVFFVVLFPASLLFQCAMSFGHDAAMIGFAVLLTPQSIGYGYAAACLWNRWRRRRRPARDAQRITLRPPALRQSVR